MGPPFSVLCVDCCYWDSETYKSAELASVHLKLHCPHISMGNICNASPEAMLKPCAKYYVAEVSYISLYNNETHEYKDNLFLWFVSNIIMIWINKTKQRFISWPYAHRIMTQMLVIQYRQYVVHFFLLSLYGDVMKQTHSALLSLCEGSH